MSKLSHGDVIRRKKAIARRAERARKGRRNWSVLGSLGRSAWEVLRKEKHD